MKTCLWELFQYCFVLFITLTVAPLWIVEVCVECPACTGNCSNGLVLRVMLVFSGSKYPHILPISDNGSCTIHTVTSLGVTQMRICTPITVVIKNAACTQRKSNCWINNDVM